MTTEANATPETPKTPESQNPGSGGGGAEPSAKAGAAAGETLAQEVARLLTEKADLNDRLLRQVAEFENYKRRTRKENDEASTRGQEALLKELLPVLDNLDRALAATKATDGAAVATLVEGVKMVQKQFLVALERFSVKPFEAEGLPFDPQVHEAIQQVDSDKLPAGSVAMVFQRGYKLGARLLRPAMVAVVKAKPVQSAGEPGTLH